MIALLLLPSALAASDAELIAQVQAEFPDLADGTLDDWETVQQLRSFAYTHTDTVVNVASPLYTDVYGWTAASAYAWFDDDSGGVICGGTGLALVELYQLWGFDAWYLGFGDPSEGGFTHVETLVRIEHDGTEIITLHDAQLDVAYTDLSGDPLDYLDVLALLAQEEVDQVALTGLGDPGYADCLVHPDDFGSMSVEDMASANWTTDPDDYTVETLDSGVVKYRSPRTVARLETVISPWYGPFLESEGLPTDLPYLHLFPFTVLGSDGADSILADALATIRAHRPTVIGFEESQGFALGETGGTINSSYDDAGLDVQTWYYGGTEIVAVDSGQALQAAWVDGHGGDYEAMFEFQSGTYGELSVSLTATQAGASLRMAVYGADGTLLDEQLGGDGVYTASDPTDGFHHVIVEADAGDVLVDDLGFGAYEPPDDGGDTGASDTGAADSGSADSGHADDGGTADSGAPTDSGAATDDGGTTDDSGAPAAGESPAPGCGCGAVMSGAGLWLWLGAVLGVAGRRRR